MITLRRYLNLIEAGLAKTFLDDHNIFCSLLDQNSHLYTGAYPAIPVRLIVIERHFERAARVLAYADKLLALSEEIVASRDEAQAIELDEEPVAEKGERGFEESLESNNPWEILAIAYLFLVPGLGFLLEERPLILLTRKIRWDNRNAFLILSPLELHFAGALLIAATLLLTFLYFYMRRLIARDESSTERSSA